jgi:hypothetical protein
VLGGKAQVAGKRVEVTLDRRHRSRVAALRSCSRLGSHSSQLGRYQDLRREVRLAALSGSGSRRPESGRRTSRTLRQVGRVLRLGCGGAWRADSFSATGTLLAAAARACQCQTDEAAERTQQRQVGVLIGSPGLSTREQQRRDRPGALGKVAADEQVVAA